MSSNILITGAAGYIGGSIIADFLSGDSPIVKKEQVYAVVRSDEQAKAVSTQGVTVLQLDLTDKQAVADAVLNNNIHIAIGTASSMDPTISLNLINALARQREIIGKDTYLIHTSGRSVFTQNTGWPAGEVKDTDPIFNTEKRLADSFPLRKTDVSTIEAAKATGVKSFIVVASTTYGRGTGVWNQVSITIPTQVQSAVTHKQVYKFDKGPTSGVHISDLTELYAQIIRKILSKEDIPDGEEGYYFGISHRVNMHEVLERLSSVLKSRGITAPDSTVKPWPSDEFAAESIGVPLPFLQSIWKSGDEMVVERPFQIGWKPRWTFERFLDSIDDEVTDVVELGKAKSSLIDSLWKVAKQG